MKKIITLFERDYHDRSLVVNEVVPGAEWVPLGEGVATQKYDGTCCLVRDGTLLKRYTLKPNRDPPRGFEIAADVDPTTGKVEGWVPVGDGPEDEWHREALDALAWRAAAGKGIMGFVMTDLHFIADGTFELLGPKIQGNPENMETHMLRRHADALALEGCPYFRPPEIAGESFFARLRVWLATQDIEGVVWHHEDGRMVKIKKRDFGLERRPVRG